MNTFIRRKAEQTDRQADKQKKQTNTQMRTHMNDSMTLIDFAARLCATTTIILVGTSHQ